MRTGRCSPAKAASRRTSRFPASCTCAWCARRSRTAILRGVDASAALKLPGVHAVWTFADVADIPPIGFRLTGLTQLEPYRQYVLAHDRVRYVGEPVAVVFATDPYLAEDAADLVELDIEALPALLDAAAEPGAVRRQRCSTEPTVIEKAYGDVDAAFAGAAHVIELDLAVGRHTGVPMETRGAIATLRRRSATCWKCTAPPKCRTGIATVSP